MEFEKLQAIIADVLNVPKDDITPETTFVDDLGADSLDIFQIIIRKIQKYEVPFPAEAQPHHNTYCKSCPFP